MEKAIEDLQKENIQKTKQMSLMKDKEIDSLHQNLQQQFENEMQQFQEKVNRLQHERDTAKKHSLEASNEIVKLTNENSKLELQIKHSEEKFDSSNYQSQSIQQQNLELKEEIKNLHYSMKQMIEPEQYAELQENESSLKQTLKTLEKQLLKERKAKLEIEQDLKSLQGKQNALDDFEELQKMYRQKEKEMISFINENEKLKKDYFSINSKLSKISRERDQ